MEKQEELEKQELEDQKPKRKKSIRLRKVKKGEEDVSFDIPNILKESSSSIIERILTEKKNPFEQLIMIWNLNLLERKFIVKNYKSLKENYSIWKKLEFEISLLLNKQKICLEKKVLFQRIKKFLYLNLKNIQDQINLKKGRDFKEDEENFSDKEEEDLKDYTKIITEEKMDFDKEASPYNFTWLQVKEVLTWIKIIKKYIYKLKKYINSFEILLNLCKYELEKLNNNIFILSNNPTNNKIYAKLLETKWEFLSDDFTYSFKLFTDLLNFYNLPSDLFDNNIDFEIFIKFIKLEIHKLSGEIDEKDDDSDVENCLIIEQSLEKDFRLSSNFFEIILDDTILLSLEEIKFSFSKQFKIELSLEKHYDELKIQEEDLKTQQYDLQTKRSEMLKKQYEILAKQYEVWHNQQNLLKKKKEFVSLIQNGANIPSNFVDDIISSYDEHCIYMEAIDKFKYTLFIDLEDKIMTLWDMRPKTLDITPTSSIVTDTLSQLNTMTKLNPDGNPDKNKDESDTDIIITDEDTETEIERRRNAMYLDDDLFDPDKCFDTEGRYFEEDPGFGFGDDPVIERETFFDNDQYFDDEDEDEEVGELGKITEVGAYTEKSKTKSKTKGKGKTKSKVKKMDSDDEADAKFYADFIAQFKEEDDNIHLNEEVKGKGKGKGKVKGKKSKIKDYTDENSNDNDNNDE